jgi:hypothetical protein
MPTGLAVHRDNKFKRAIINGGTLSYLSMHRSAPRIPHSLARGVSTSTRSDKRCGMLHG